MSELNLKHFMEQATNILSTKTVIGEPYQISENRTIIPIMELSFGLGESGGAKKVGRGMGGHLKPSALLLIDQEGVQLIQMQSTDSISKLIDMAPGILTKMQNFFIPNQPKSKKYYEKKQESDDAGNE